MRQVPLKPFLIPVPAFQPEEMPARQDRQSLRGKTTKLLTLLRPANCEQNRLIKAPMPFCTAFLKQELTAILKSCPPAPEEVPEGRRWQDWDPFPAVEQLDRLYPLLRMRLILDHLVGHRSRDLVQGCGEHGIGLLYTPC